jgi:predicted O-methyltransferase YrrM
VNSFLTEIAFQIQDIAVRPYVYRALWTLDRMNDGTAVMLAESIRDAFRPALSDEEQVHVHNIEAVRRALNGSAETIDMVDYGADPVHGTHIRWSVGEMALLSSKPYRWSLLLFFIVERLTPKRCLEFGTCLGISTLYQSAALELNGEGILITMEGSPTLAERAKENFTALNRSNIVSMVGKFSDLLPGVLEEHHPFDYVFIDGHHEGNATVRYFEQMLPWLMNNAVLIFDDIHWSSGMKQAWKRIAAHPRVKYSVDLYQAGIVIVS